MTLHDDWRRILRKAHSIRWIIAAVIFSMLEGAFAIITAFYSAPPLGIPPGVFAFFAAVSSGFAFYTRLMAQKGYDDGE